MEYCSKPKTHLAPCPVKGAMGKLEHSGHGGRDSILTFVLKFESITVINAVLVVVILPCAICK